MTLKQQWKLGIGQEEPIHAASAHDKLTQLQTTHANKKIQLILAQCVIDLTNSYKQEQTKFDQLRPILASASLLIATNSSATSSLNSIPPQAQPILEENNSTT